MHVCWIKPLLILNERYSTFLLHSLRTMILFLKLALNCSLRIMGIISFKLLGTCMWYIRSLLQVRELKEKQEVTCQPRSPVNSKLQPDLKATSVLSLLHSLLFLNPPFFFFLLSLLSFHTKKGSRRCSDLSRTLELSLKAWWRQHYSHFPTSFPSPSGLTPLQCAKYYTLWQLRFGNYAYLETFPNAKLF